MAYINLDGLMSRCTHEGTHAHTPQCHCGDYVSFTASRLEKKKKKHEGVFGALNNKIETYCNQKISL